MVGGWQDSNAGRPTFFFVECKNVEMGKETGVIATSRPPRVAGDPAIEDGGASELKDDAASHNDGLPMSKGTTNEIMRSTCFGGKVETSSEEAESEDQK